MSALHGIPVMQNQHRKLEVMAVGNEPTLTVFYDETPIFKSYGKWLHPLFELEDYLADHPMQLERLLLQDKIIGKAAALLIHRLGIRTVKAGLLSRLGEVVLQRNGIAYTYEQLVDRIHCQTEELLAEVEDPEKAYGLLRVRAGR
jgi:zinc transport system ATP-binding protein